MEQIYTADQLLSITGCKTPAELVAYLENKNIPFHRRGKSGQPWTTIQAINKSLGVTARSRSQAPANDVVMVK